MVYSTCCFQCALPFQRKSRQTAPPEQVNGFTSPPRCASLDMSITVTYFSLLDAPKRWSCIGLYLINGALPHLLIQLIYTALARGGNDAGPSAPRSHVRAPSPGGGRQPHLPCMLEFVLLQLGQVFFLRWGAAKCSFLSKNPSHLSAAFTTTCVSGLSFMRSVPF